MQSCAFAEFTANTRPKGILANGVREKSKVLTSLVCPLREFSQRCVEIRGVSWGIIEQQQH